MTENSPTHHLGFLAATAATVLALTACAPGENTEDQDSANGAQETPQIESTTESDQAEAENGQDDQSNPEEASDHDLTAALESVLEDYPDGVITEFDHDDGVLEVHVVDDGTEWELELDPSTFEVLRSEEEPVDAEDQTEVDANDITIVEAVDAAEAEGGASATQGDLDTENGTVVYEIELDNNTDVVVDVSTGEVISSN